MTARRARPSARPRGKAALPNEQGVLALTDLAQVRVLADPLRLRLLRCFCEERTTKQAAQVLGLKPTGLYHHVATLERAGLIRRTRTRQNRGAVEKYFVAAARAFVADPRIFDVAPNRNDRDALRGVASSALLATARELDRLMARAPERFEEEGVVSYLEIDASEPELRRLRRAIERLLEGIVARAAKAGKGTRDGGARKRSAAPARRHRLMVAFFPLDDDARGR